MGKLGKTLVTILVGVVIWFSPIPAGITPQGWHMLAIFVATILGFILNPMPIGAIAFTSIALSVLLNVLKQYGLVLQIY